MLHDLQEELRNDGPGIDWKEGDTCFFYSGRDRGVFPGTIIGIYPDGRERKALVRVTGADVGMSYSLNALFRSQAEIDAAICAVKARNFETDVEEYIRQMPGKDGPFTFALAHDLTERGGDTDRAARYAFASRVKDLFGIALDI